MDVRVTYTEYINGNGSKDAHKQEWFIVSTDNSEDKRAYSEEDAKDG
jgi:hypothetical protein